MTLHHSNGDGRKYSFHDVMSKLKELSSRAGGGLTINFDEMDTVMEVLQNYNIIEIERQGKHINKADSRNIKFSLKQEYSDLVDALNEINSGAANGSGSNF